LLRSVAGFCNLLHRLEQVALGTTHAVNAIVQRRGLRRVAVLRIGAPGTLAVPPCTGWPADLVAAIVGSEFVARGGVEIDGRALSLDADEIRRFGITPKIALLSHSSFGTGDTPTARKMRDDFLHAPLFSLWTLFEFCFTRAL